MGGISAGSCLVWEIAVRWGIRVETVSTLRESMSDLSDCLGPGMSSEVRPYPVKAAMMKESDMVGICSPPAGRGFGVDSLEKYVRFGRRGRMS